jgi:DNA polymerase elongation subunit (family B)
MKILLLDIETSPNTAHVWGLFKQNISINQLQESSYVLCWAAKWLGEDGVTFSSVMKTSHKNMLKAIHKMLEEADAVIHYNGTRFDIPTLNKEFLKHGMFPPSSYKQIDLLKTARQQFRFPSNKLDYVASSLGLGKKHKHEGHELWVKCMARDVAAWATMEEYNKQDVVLLEKVYYKLLPWIKGHPNINLHNPAHNGIVCSNCGGSHTQRRGFHYTTVAKYQRYQCRGCGTWMRSRVSDKEQQLFAVSL